MTDNRIQVIVFLGWLTGLLFSDLQAGAQSARDVRPAADHPPVIPVGTDAYQMWDRWPVQRIGDRAYMRSTYDRSGGNEAADASHFLFMDEGDRSVTLDVKGKGILYFFRANHWHGSPWHFTIDGQDHVVQETATRDPMDAQKKYSHTRFIPSAPFPEPLSWTWSTTRGADLIWTPMPFERSLQIAYSRTHYGTGYYIYHHYADDAALSRPIRSWTGRDAPGKALLSLIDSSGLDIAPRHIQRKKGSIRLNKTMQLLADLRKGPAVVRALKITLPLDKAVELERLRLRITWDGADSPSVDAPLCLFFGAGTFYNRDKREYLVRGFPINIHYDYPGKKVTLACYYPMPFFRSARFEISGSPAAAVLDYEIRYAPYRGPANHLSYFHATYRDFPEPVPGRDLLLLDTKGAEGQQRWSGNFAGTSLIFSHNGFLGTLEGDPRFFFDGSLTPQAYGTGTEEWGGGGDYWGGQNMTLPFAGHPCGTTKKENAADPKDLIESAYRFLLADLMPFGNRAVIRLEHGAENLSREHYETLVYWYGLPAPSLIKTDEVDIGKTEDEQAHRYTSPGASAVESIRSRYEWGIDSLPLRPWGMDPAQAAYYRPGAEVYPAHTEDGRHTRSVSAFTVSLEPDNYGALLRRTLDYRYPNQEAKVYIAENGAAGDTTWSFAGTWYLAGSNTCVYSNPRGETDKRVYQVQTSDRRFRDDEFLLPARLTRGRKSIRVKLVCQPSDTELYPAHPFPEKSAWSELRYAVYSYVMPDFSLK
ncbi:DUF2961 domain-containing protein [Compostibacter hankyongensis]|uniref:DUF2961 domain-containing protein n=1 Tax=Compostibacter hankyongensis TaxID=1007089 RepID=A0ABP8FX14_9BACT